MIKELLLQLERLASNTLLTDEQFFHQSSQLVRSLNEEQLAELFQTQEYRSWLKRHGDRVLAAGNPRKIDIRMAFPKGWKGRIVDPMA